MPHITHTLVCQHDSCRRNSSETVLKALQEEKDNSIARGSPCTGQCNMEPTVRVMRNQIWYLKRVVQHQLKIMNNKG